MGSTRFRFEATLSFAAILCVLIMSRMIFSPLMLRIEADLGLSHAAAASFFLILATGYSVTMVLSGFVSRALGHRRTIVLATLLDAAGLAVVACAPSLGVVYPGLLLVGAATGFYIPSGLASLYALYPSDQWGRAIGIHEVGASSSFVIGPLLAQLTSGVLSWRWLLAGIGLASAALGLVHHRAGRGGEFPGQPPVLRNLRALFGQRAFAVTVVLFGLILGAGVGGYSVLPTYLVVERGMPERTVNLVVSASRVSGVLVVFVVGWLADRVNLRVALAAVVAGCGVSTALTGLAGGAVLIGAQFVQPILTGAFFPLALSFLPTFVPAELRNLAVSFAIPVGYLVGGGVVPEIMGLLGEHGRFSLGFTVLGVLLLLGVALFPLMGASTSQKRAVAERP